MREYIWAITYDITVDKNRQKICNILKDFGRHVQRSVFECKLSRPDVDNLIQLLLPYTDPMTDSIRAYPLCQNCLLKAKFYGKAFHQRKDYLVV